ncbi:MFS transporter [Ferrovum sp. PN-J185]|uniref:MFS transporter n=1 Tax=Ferrovum sp. PN-J185 TaxID=1356306 RepID=UPI00079A32C8|nr:MFS transporter [Ferrovum sp. PN-J185]KXW55463.1 multidrug resistance protein MdtH [Ferrovum sp. PN-J185]
MIIKSLSSLPKTVWLIGFISLLNDSASEMIYPLLPFYIVSVLGAGPKILGLIEGIAEATASLFKLLSGIIVDRTKKSKIFIIIGYAVPSIGRPILSIITSWHAALFIRFFDRLGKGLRTSPRDAILALSVPENKRGITFGLHRSLDNLGAFVGPIVATILLSYHFSLKDIFLFAIIPGFIAIILTLQIKEPEKIITTHHVKISWRLSSLPSNFKQYLFSYALLSLGNSSDLFILLRAKEIGISEQYIPLLWAFLSLIISVLSTPLSGLSDRIGRKTLLISSWLIYGLFNLLLAQHFVHVSLLIFSFILYGVYKGMSEGIEKALVADLVDKNHFGTAFGWFNLIGGLFLLPASFIFGWLYQTYNYSYAFLFSSCCCLMASCYAWINFHRTKLS